VYRLYARFAGASGLYLRLCRVCRLDLRLARTIQLNLRIASLDWARRVGRHGASSRMDVAVCSEGMRCGDDSWTALVLVVELLAVL
jgi:hypothetical protein